MNAQEKLNKIDALLYAAGFRQPDTVGKVELLIKERKVFKNAAEDDEGRIQGAIHYLEYGYLDE